MIFQVRHDPYTNLIFCVNTALLLPAWSYRLTSNLVSLVVAATTRLVILFCTVVNCRHPKQYTNSIISDKLLIRMSDLVSPKIF